MSLERVGGSQGHHFTQFRPATAQNMGEMYSPARDLAWNFVPTTIGVLESLRDPSQWPAWMTAYAAANNITVDDIAVASMAFAKAVEMFANPELPTMMQVMQESGYMDVPEPARVLFQMRLGQHVAGMYFVSTRDMCMPERPPTMNVQVKAMVSKSQEFMTWLTNRSPLESSWRNGFRTIGRGLAVCLRATWYSISKLPGSRTRILSGKSATSSSETVK